MVRVRCESNWGWRGLARLVYEFDEHDRSTALSVNRAINNRMTNTDHYHLSIFLCGPCRRVQYSDDVIRWTSVDSQWNSNHAVMRWIQRHVLPRVRQTVVPAVLLLWWDEQWFSLHYQLTCTAQYQTRRSFTLNQRRYSSHLRCFHIGSHIKLEQSQHQPLAKNSSSYNQNHLNR